MHYDKSRWASLVCYFLMIGVHADGAVLIDGEREPRRRDRRLTIAPALNPSLAGIFPRDDQLFWITNGMCSCDLYPRGGISKHTNLDRERNKYRAKGWSESKIDRALRAKLAVHPMVARGQRDDTPLELLYDLLINLSTCDGGVRIFTRMYKGDPNEEKVVGHTRMPVNLADLVNGRNFPKDTLIDVIGPADSCG
jgi:hypothetical protein